MLPQMYIDLHIKCPLLLSDFTETWNLSIDFRNVLRFLANQFSGSRVVRRGRTDTQVDVTKLIVAFRNFAHAPKQCKESEMKISVTKASLTVSNERNENWRWSCWWCYFSVPTYSLRFTLLLFSNRGTQLVQALRYKLDGRGFDSRWCPGNTGVDLAFNRNEYQEYFLVVKADGT